MRKVIAMLPLVFLLACSVTDIPPNDAVPTPQQIEYQELELIGFIHYTVNAFTDKEWGYGDEPESIFNPSELDVEQWVKTAKAGGMKQLILTAKHHDGFCLWPSEYTEHSVKNAPVQVDIVKAFTEACRKHGIRPGLYLSPWDRNHADYGNKKYIEYYRNQLKELLTNYGPIYEIWFDGANGGDGYYGGANEIRNIDRDTYYEWPETWALVKSLQPDILIFSDAGPDIHWIGNEKGYASETFWSTFDRDAVTVGSADRDYLNTGDPNGPDWVVGECDVSIRPGWFYHKDEDDEVKTPQQLVDLYYKSVGRNATFLLNLPPDQRGLIHENDVKSLTEFKSIIDETFATNLALNATAFSTSHWNGKNFTAAHLVDTDAASYWAAAPKDRAAALSLTFDNEIVFDRIMLQEPIRLGQRISEFTVEAFVNDAWQDIATGTTIGYKRLLRIDPVTTDHIRIKIKNANNTPALSNIGLYKASSREAIMQ